MKKLLTVLLLAGTVTSMQAGSASRASYLTEQIQSITKSINENITSYGLNQNPKDLGNAAILAKKLAPLKKELKYFNNNQIGRAFLARCCAHPVKTTLASALAIAIVAEAAYLKKKHVAGEEIGEVLKNQAKVFIGIFVGLPLLGLGLIDLYPERR